MFKEERLNEILKLINVNKRASIEELIKKFNVSEVTIRKDLNELEKANFLKRTFGGAIKSWPIVDVPSFEKRKIINSKIKKKISLKAREIIEENETIIIDTGTTTFELAKSLNVFDNLIVITSSLDVCVQLVKYSNGIRVISTGGEINKLNLSMSGSAVNLFLKQYKANKAFIGITAFSLEHGFTTSDENIARVKKQMIDSSNIRIILADSSKFNKVSFSKVCDYKDIDILITDEGISEDYLRALQKENIKVCIV